MIMKPIFIYRYERGMQKQSKEFFKLFLKKGDEIEAEFNHHQKELKHMHEEGLHMANFHGDDTSAARSAIHGESSLSQSGIVGKVFSNTKRKFHKSKTGTFNDKKINSLRKKPALDNDSASNTRGSVMSRKNEFSPQDIEEKHQEESSDDAPPDFSGTFGKKTENPTTINS